MSLAVVMPVFDDWASCAILLSALDIPGALSVETLRVVVVDDGSIDPAPADLGATLGGGRITGLRVVELACNVGHQRAIALGLAVLARETDDERVVVMDSDGEDDPAALDGLLAALAQTPGGVVAAGRASRSEGAVFRAGYGAYTLLFRLLTGRRIDFGNFCAFGPAVLRRLVRMPETWNHLAAAVMRCKAPLVVVPVRRGRRYAGRSSMNVPALIAHGLSAFAVFSDHVFARLLLAAAAAGGLAIAVAAGVVVVRLTTDLATPGWATTVVGVSAVFLMQALLVTLVAALQMLATRSQVGAQPAALPDLFVARVRDLPLGRKAS